MKALSLLLSGLFTIALTPFFLQATPKKTTKSKGEYLLKPGDIVFQDTGGEQGRAVSAATDSPYTHCGVVVENEGRLFVLEAVQPVSAIPLAQWKARSDLFHARRLKDPSKLTPAVFKKAQDWALKQFGKPYDLKFQWDDESLYCSELVWKVFAESASIRLCEPKRFQDYFLKKPEVRRVIASRYGSAKNLPKNEPVVAPSDLAASALLKEVPRADKKG